MILVRPNWRQYWDDGTSGFYRLDLDKISFALVVDYNHESTTDNLYTVCILDIVNSQLQAVLGPVHGANTVEEACEKATLVVKDFLLGNAKLL